MRVVLDTNILVSALMTPRGLPFQAVRLWQEKRYDLVTSTWQIEELRDVSRRDQVRQRLNTSYAGTLINALWSKAFVLDKLPSVDYSPDPDDNPIIAAAIAGDAQYIVSGDKGDLLALVRVEGVSIVSVRTFVGLFS